MLEALLESWVFGEAEHGSDLTCPDMTFQEVTAQHLQLLCNKSVLLAPVLTTVTRLSFPSPLQRGNFFSLCHCHIHSHRGGGDGQPGLGTSQPGLG